MANHLQSLPVGEKDAGNLEARNGTLSNEFYNGKQMILGYLDPIYFAFDSMAVDGTQRPILLNAITYLMEIPVSLWEGLEHFQRQGNNFTEFVKI